MQQNNIKTILSKIASTFEDALFPTICLACGSFFHPEYRKNGYGHELGNWKKEMSPFVCPACLHGFAPIKSPVCTLCGIMFKNREDYDHICGKCIEMPKKFRMARSLGVYDQTLMKLILRLKYRGKIVLARPLGRLLLSAFIQLWDINSIDIAVPVPLHIVKFRKRGFNQAFLLIKDWPAIANDLNLWPRTVKIEKHLIIRHKATSPQTALGRGNRIKNIKNAFKVNRPSDIKDKRILLVDDVYTTGATAVECSKVLMRGGAKCVDVLTLARAI